MNTQQVAVVARPTPQTLICSGQWTARGMGAVQRELESMDLGGTANVALDASGIDAFDSAGAWLLNGYLVRLRSAGAVITLDGLRPAFAKLLGVVEQVATELAEHPASHVDKSHTALERIGRSASATLEEVVALLSFVGESAIAFAGCVMHPTRFRWRPVLFNIRSAGFDALPIVGLLSFLLGIVVAYQGADQLRQYGANIFVADLVGLSMLREFAPLIAAIIIAGRSGSAYAAQIGTMAVTEEIDAMRTMGIAPLELLVLPQGHRACDRAAFAHGVCRCARCVRRHDYGQHAARCELRRVSRPAGEGRKHYLVLGGHWQSAGVRCDHQCGRLLSRLSNPRRSG